MGILRGEVKHGSGAYSPVEGITCLYSTVNRVTNTVEEEGGNSCRVLGSQAGLEVNMKCERQSEDRTGIPGRKMAKKSESKGQLRAQPG